MEPQNGDYLDSLGLVYERLGKLDQAETYLLQAWQSIAAGPILPEHLGLYFKRGKLNEAIARWQEALREGELCAPIDVDPAQVIRIKRKLDTASSMVAR